MGAQKSRPKNVPRATIVREGKRSKVDPRSEVERFLGEPAGMAILDESQKNLLQSMPILILQLRKIFLSI